MTDNIVVLQALVRDLDKLLRDSWKERDALKAEITAMKQQEPAGEVVHNGESAGLYDILEQGALLYALPGAQNVPKEAIAKILTAVMDIAVSNGADSRSMPDEYVEVAAWLCGIPAQPAPSVPEVTDAMIEAIESRAEQSYRRHHGGAREQQIVPADALSWHIIHATRKVLSEAPEAKP